MTEPGLRTLFDLSDTTSFLDRHWPDHTMLAHGPVERLAGLVDHDLGALVAMKKRYTRAFFRTPNGGASSVAVSEGQELALYNAGFTLYFHSLRDRRLDAWIDALDRELGLVRGATRVSAFASRQGIGLKPHYDPNDNFVCQAQGVKRWRVARNAHVRYPTLGYTIGDTPSGKQATEAPEGFPTEMPTPFETVEMKPGSVMFMPRGTWHDTETLDTASLHFNIQCGLATWKDVLEFVLLGTTALHDAALREPVQHLLTADRDAEIESHVRQKLAVLFRSIVEGDLHLDRDALFRFVAQRRSA